MKHTNITQIYCERFKARKVRQKRFTLSVLKSLVQDHYILLALRTQPKTKQEWKLAYSNARKEVFQQLHLLNDLWAKGKCESYKMYPRGYSVALFGLLSVVSKFETTQYLLTRQYIEWARRFALLETLASESPFRPLKVGKAQPTTLLGLKYSKLEEDEDEEESELRYRYEDTSWRSLRERDYREREDYDDYEYRQEFYSGFTEGVESKQKMLVWKK